MTTKPDSGREPRITHQTHLVLTAFLVDPTQFLSGYDVIGSTGLSTGTLYPILMRLEQAKWLESHREEIDPKKEGRPRRRLYRITQTGLERARNLRAEVLGGVPA